MPYDDETRGRGAQGGEATSEDGRVGGQPGNAEPRPNLEPTTPANNPAPDLGLFESTQDAPPRDDRRPGPDQRRTERQTLCMSVGYHPLCAAVNESIRLHSEAAPADDRTADGLRCGSCAHRRAPNRAVARRYPKCGFGGDWQRASAGPGTDVRAWWPACVDYVARAS